MYLSVVISTYNGSKYILEQLDSIRNQTRRADEVMIIDDCSTDDTVEKINNFLFRFYFFIIPCSISIISSHKARDDFR
jgi:glycosyltransferase involved in cell wall biosynthesis